MDDWIGRLRDLAPDTEVGEDDTEAALGRLLAEIEAEQARGTVRRPGRTRPHRQVRSGLRLPFGAVAAIAAVIVVALVATGAVIVSQWLSKPPATTGQPDLRAELLPQVPAGQYLRIAQTTVRAVQTDLESGPAPDDSYLVVSETAAFYVPADGGDWAMAYPEESAVLELVGPHAQEMYDGGGWRNTASVGWTSDPPAVDPRWVAGLPHDPDALVRAFAARYGQGDQVGVAAGSSGLVATMLGDPAWFLADRATREALVATVRAVDSFTVTETSDGDLRVQREPGTFTLIDGDTLLPTRSWMPASAFVGGDRAGWPDTTSTFEVSIVNTVPEFDDPEPPEVATVQCNGIPILDSAFAEARSPATLDAAGMAALAGTDVPVIEPDEWFVVSQTPDELVLMSTEFHFEVGRAEQGPPPTHELLQIIRDGSGAWSLGMWTQCALAVYWDDKGIADVELDPEFPPTPDSTTLHLLVTERACASGQTAAGRVDLVDVAELDERVEILIGVYGLDSAACPSNPPTPFLVWLSEPLGDRAIIDLTYLEGRVLRAPQ